jgi:hypothetical protein
MYSRDLADHPGGFPAPRTGNEAAPNSEVSAAEQGFAGNHRRASPRVSKGAACHAIMAIFAMLKPAAPAATTGPGSGELALRGVMPRDDEGHSRR